MGYVCESDPKLALFVVSIQMPDNTQRNGKMSRCNEKQSNSKKRCSARVRVCMSGKAMKLKAATAVAQLLSLE